MTQIEVEFNYEGTIINIQSKTDEKMEDIIKRFLSKIGKQKGELYFLYNGDKLNENLSLNSQAKDNDIKRNKMIILAKLDENSEEEESLIKSKYIICPECKENARILINDYKIEIYDCKNGHKINNISIKDFEKIQSIDESKIICNDCNKTNKSNSYENAFYICYNCKQNLCPICKSKHNKQHNIIDYEDKYFICDKHYETYGLYCNNCKKDICIICENEHSGHNSITYGKIFPDINKIKEETINLKNKIEKLKEDIKEIINKLNNVIYNIDDYFNIYENIMKCYFNKKRNYFLLQNINDMIKYKINIIQDINNIINENNISNKFNNIIEMYNKINLNKNINIDSINLKYNKKENENENNNNLKDEIKEENYINNKENNNTDNKQDFKDDNIKKLNITGNKELLMDSEEKEDSNYKDFDITKIKKLATINTKLYGIFGLLVLKDGRILIYGYEKTNFDSDCCCVCDIKNSCYFKMNFYIKFLIQMDDGIVIIKDAYHKISLVNIKENSYEIIDSLDIGLRRIFKLSNQNIIIAGSEHIKLYKYENKKLTFVKEKKIKFMKKLTNAEYLAFINEKLTLVQYYEYGFLSGKGTRFIGLFDIEKDKNIKSFKRDYYYNGLIKNNILVFVKYNELYPIDLNNLIIKEENKLSLDGIVLPSILSLNDNQYLVLTDRYAYQLEYNNQFKIIGKFSLKYREIHIYPKNRFICYNKNYSMFHIYG